MRRSWKIAIGLMVCAAIAAVALLWPRMPGAAWAALEGAERYELLSIEPDKMKWTTAPSATFCGYPVLGQTSVVDPATRSKLNAAFRKGVEAGVVDLPACFDPRHGIRVTRAGKTMDFVICFACARVQVWHGDIQIASWTTDRSPEATFDQVLEQAGVALAEKE